MKARHLFLIILIGFVMVLFWWLLQKRQSSKIETEIQPKLLATTNKPAAQAQKTDVAPATKPRWPDPNSPEEVKAWLAEGAQKEQARKEHENDDWKTPIEFFGRVLDESNNAVDAAQVDFDCNDLSASGTSYYHTKSDLNGLFSLKGITGKLLGVYVNKEGYYSYDPHGQNFCYAGENQNFVPDAGNPVIFRLRKKGEGANLIHYDRSFQLPKDGTPILVDLPEGKITPSSPNAIEVEAWINDTEKVDRWKFNWKCRVSIPGGGLQIFDEQFPFLAPEENYAPEEIVDMPATNNPAWSDIVRRNYYVRTADGKFGRMLFSMIPGGDHFCEVNLFFNPSGSRNLETK